MMLKTTAQAALVPLALGITPQQMLSSPRRSDVVPNANGDFGVFTASTYSFADHASTTTWNLMNLRNGRVSPLGLNSSEVSEILWTGSSSTSILYVNTTNEDAPDGVTLWTTDATNTKTRTKIASLEAPFSGFKAVMPDNNTISWVAATLANADGTPYLASAAATSYSSGRLYDNIFVRHWDFWIEQQRWAVFSGSLTRRGSTWSASGTPRNLLKQLSSTVTRPETPVQPFGGSSDYDISPDGSTVAFLTKAPELPKANFTASYIYVVPHDASSPPQAINGPGGFAPATAKGASASPVFSHSGTKLAYMQMDGASYESDRNKLYVATIVGDVITVRSVATNWDRSPAVIAWSMDDKTLYVAAEDRATTKIFTISATAGANFKPINITGGSSVSSMYIFSNGTAGDTGIIHASSIWSSADFYSLRMQGNSTGSKRYLLQANLVDQQLRGLSAASVEEVYYDGAQTKVQAWVVKPAGFDAKKKYPLAYLIHGGPQSAWANSWSTRWNLKVWADQGYVVVAPNPTGSTGFGKKFTDDIQDSWGGLPYEDLVKGFDYIKSSLPYVDTTRAIEAGASYGGYMTNWIQGHDLGRKFKALVTHDGATSTLNQLSSEELWFPQHDFADKGTSNNTLWQKRINYRQWDPLAHAANFSTPHFVVHNDLDFRLPVSEGIALFNALQERGVPSRFLSFPDENHWVLKPENSLVWHTEIYNWINHYSGVGGALNDHPITQ